MCAIKLMVEYTGLKTHLDFDMKIHNINSPVFIKSLPRHADVKEELINVIRSGMEFSIRDSKISVTNSDYHLAPDFFRIVGPKYWAIFFPEARAYLNEMATALGLDEWSISKYWYQEYRQGDYQPWHTHPGTMLTNVYYLSLPEGSMKTTLSISGVETELEVKEGDIITIPSYVKHCSKPHLGDKPKIVIAFNAEMW